MSKLCHAAKTMAGVIAGSVLAGVGFGLGGVILNAVLLTWMAPQLKVFLTSADSHLAWRVTAGVLACALALLPGVYAVLAGQRSFKRRLGEAVKPHEDKLMEALARIVTEYVASRTADSPHAATLAACIKRVPDLPAPVRFVLARLARSVGLSEALEVAVQTRSAQQGSWDAVVRPVLAMGRSKLDGLAFSSGRAWITYLLAVNLALGVLLLGIMGFSLDGLAKGVEVILAVVVGVPLLAWFYLYGPPRLIDNVKDCWRTLVHVVILVVTLITGVKLIARRRSPIARWTGCTMIMLVYGFLIALACALACEGFEHQQSHILVPVFCAVFLIPAWLLMRWVRRSGSELAENKP